MPNYCTYPQALELFEAVDQAKQDTLIAGAGINIAPDGKTISAPSGSGDMLKSVYDTDNDGIVDKAETLNDGANALSATIPELNYVHGVTSSIQTQLNGKQGTLTFDNKPTNSSNNPVKSDGIYDAITDVYSVMGENGAKNELDVNLPELKANNTSGTWSDNVYTIGSLTFTFNADKTITVNGTNGSSNTIFWVKGSGSQKTITFDRKMILSGLPSGASETLFWYGGNNIGTVYDVHEVAANTPISLAIVIKANTSVSSKVFSTMIRDARDTNPDYQPPAMTNRELTDEIKGEALSLTTTQTLKSGELNSVIRMGRIVSVCFSFENVTAEGYTTLASVPASIKPSGILYFNANGTSMYIDSNGNIKNTTALNNSNIRGSFVYNI